MIGLGNVQFLKQIDGNRLRKRAAWRLSKCLFPVGLLCFGGERLFNLDC